MKDSEWKLPGSSLRFKNTFQVSATTTSIPEMTTYWDSSQKPGSEVERRHLKPFAPEFLSGEVWEPPTWRFYEKEPLSAAPASISIKDLRESGLEAHQEADKPRVGSQDSVMGKASQ